VELALRVLGEKQLTTAHGKPVVIATLEYKSYSDGLVALGNQAHPEHPDLIILDSVEDAQTLRLDASPQSVVPGSHSLLIIPPWTTGEKREAAELVSVNLRQELLKSSRESSSR
jgi:hypothetical protein